MQRNLDEQMKYIKDLEAVREERRGQRQLAFLARQTSIKRTTASDMAAHALRRRSQKTQGTPLRAHCVDDTSGRGVIARSSSALMGSSSALIRASSALRRSLSPRCVAEDGNKFNLPKRELKLLSEKVQKCSDGQINGD